MYEETIHLKKNWWQNPDAIGQAIDNESIRLLRRMVKLMESQATVDISNRQKVVVEGSLPTVLWWYTVWWALTNYPTWWAPINNPTTGFFLQTWSWPVDPRWTNIDQARLTYNQWTRSHLSFT